MFSKNGGKIFFGGYDHSLLANPQKDIAWMKTTSDEEYTINLQDLKIGGILMPSGPLTAKIDSGVSMTYLTKKQHRVILQAIDAQCKNKYKCFGQKVSPGCYKFEPTDQVSMKDFYMSYPIVSFLTYEDKAIQWFPSDYLYQQYPNVYCFAADPVAENDSSLVFGASFLRQNLVIFDIENSQVGIARANSQECIEMTDGSTD